MLKKLCARCDMIRAEKERIHKGDEELHRDIIKVRAGRGTIRIGRIPHICQGTLRYSGTDNVKRRQYHDKSMVQYKRGT